MNNNKNHIKTDKKTNAEMRKMYHRTGGDIGIKNGVKAGTEDYNHNSKPNSQKKHIGIVED